MDAELSLTRNMLKALKERLLIACTWDMRQSRTTLFQRYRQQETLKDPTLRPSTLGDRVIGIQELG